MSQSWRGYRLAKTGKPKLRTKTPRKKIENNSYCQLYPYVAETLTTDDGIWSEDLTQEQLELRDELRATLAAAMLTAIDGLDPKTQEVIRLFSTGDYSQQQIAKQAGMKSHSSVSTMLFGRESTEASSGYRGIFENLRRKLMEDPLINETVSKLRNIKDY